MVRVARSLADRDTPDRLDYRPHERSPSAAQIAWTLANEHATCVDLVETGAEGILLDVDLPADYEALLRRWEAPTAGGDEPRGGQP